MSCSRSRRRSEVVSEEVEAIRREVEVEAAAEAEAERESFRESRCFLVVWRDRSGRRRCKCCCRRHSD